MKNRVLIFILSVLPLMASAQQPLIRSVQPLRSQAPTTPIVRASSQERGPFFQVGMDIRGQRDSEDQTVKAKSMPSFSGGYILDHWIFQAEYATTTTSTGNSTLSVDRKFETGMAWAYWQTTDTKIITPFLGAGLGIQREIIQTNLLGLSETDKSGNYWTTGASFGLRFFAKSPIWLSAEGRLYKNGHQDPDPQIGGLLRLGFVIH